MSIEVHRPESVGMSSARLGRIGPAMTGLIDSGEIAGLSTMISRRGKLIHAATFGYQDREAGIPMADDTIFRIYSMTKPVVATALMLLHEEGAFELDAPVAGVLPAFGDTPVLQPDGTTVEQTRPMTIRDLLVHTSGLSYDFMTDTPIAQAYRNARLMNDATRSLADFVDTLATIPLSSQPGSRWHYGLGIDVAARLIEVLSGQPLGDFLRTRLFEPLGMPDTGFGIADAALPRLSAMYGLPDLFGPDHSAKQIVEAALAGSNERRDVSSTYPTDAPEVFQRGGIGLFSTIGDYHRFASMLLANGRAGNGRIASRKTIELMHRNHLPPALMPFEVLGSAFGGYGFGLGSRVMLDTGLSGTTGSDGEYGWAGAARTHYWVDPAEGMVGVFMSQYMSGVLRPERTFHNLAYQAIDD